MQDVQQSTVPATGTAGQVQTTAEFKLQVDDVVDKNQPEMASGPPLEYQESPTEGEGTPDNGKRLVKVHGGQNGPPLDLVRTKLNEKEFAVASALSQRDQGATASLAELAGECFPTDSGKANSWVRNALRRLVRGKWVTRVDRGSYQITDCGRQGLKE